MYRYDSLRKTRTRNSGNKTKRRVDSKLSGEYFSPTKRPSRQVGDWYISENSSGTWGLRGHPSFLWASGGEWGRRRGGMDYSQIWKRAGSREFERMEWERGAEMMSFGFHSEGGVLGSLATTVWYSWMSLSNSWVLIVYQSHSSPSWLSLVERRYTESNYWMTRSKSIHSCFNMANFGNRDTSCPDRLCGSRAVGDSLRARAYKIARNSEGVKIRYTGMGRWWTNSHFGARQVHMPI